MDRHSFRQGIKAVAMVAALVTASAVVACGSSSSGGSSTVGKACSSSAECGTGLVCKISVASIKSALCVDPGGKACGTDETACLVGCSCNDGTVVTAGGCTNGVCDPVDATCGQACTVNGGYTTGNCTTQDGTIGGGSGGAATGGGAGGSATIGGPMGTCQLEASSGTGGVTGGSGGGTALGGGTGSGGDMSGSGGSTAACDATDPSGQSCISDADCKVECKCAFSSVVVGKCQGINCAGIADQCNTACSAMTENYSGQHCLSK